MSSLRRDLESKFGKGGFTLTLTDKPGKEAHSRTLYILGTNEDPFRVLADHGHLRLTQEDRNKIKNLFDPDKPTKGVTHRDVSIIAAEKVMDQVTGVPYGEYAVSNVLKHELGHQLAGKACGHIDDKCTPSPEPRCGGVMVPCPDMREDLSYTKEFIEHVKQNPLTVEPEAPRYAAVWQPSTEDEVQLYSWTTDGLRAEYDKLWSEGWRLKLLSPYVLNGEVRYDAVFRPGTEGEIQVYGWTYEDYRAEYDKLWEQGWRLKLLSPYVTGTEVRYTAVWQPATEGEIQVYGWTYEDYRAEYDKLWDQGWRLKLLSPYVIGTEVRYTAVWQPGTEGEIQVYNWTADGLRAKYDELWPEGWRLKLLSPYVLNGEVRYDAAFRPGIEGEIQVFDWFYEDYRAEYDKLWEQGWRLKLLNPF